MRRVSWLSKSATAKDIARYNEFEGNNVDEKFRNVFPDAEGPITKTLDKERRLRNLAHYTVAARRERSSRAGRDRVRRADYLVSMRAVAAQRINNLEQKLQTSQGRAKDRLQYNLEREEFVGEQYSKEYAKLGKSWLPNSGQSTNPPNSIQRRMSDGTNDSRFSKRIPARVSWRSAPSAVLAPAWQLPPAAESARTKRSKTPIPLRAPLRRRARRTVPRQRRVSNRLRRSTR